MAELKPFSFKEKFMYEDVKQKINKNQIFFNRDSLCLQELRELIKNQIHKTLILWAFECTLEPLNYLNKKYPNETRFTEAYNKCKLWAEGKIKMPEAKKAILSCHAFAKEIESKHAIALCHALGQGLSTVHVETHALGLPFYELTAIVLKNKDNFEEEVTKKINYYIKVLKEKEKLDKTKYNWAKFLQIDRENREKLLSKY